MSTNTTKKININKVDTITIIKGTLPLSVLLLFVGDTTNKPFLGKNKVHVTLELTC